MDESRNRDLEQKTLADVRRLTESLARDRSEPDMYVIDNVGMLAADDLSSFTLVEAALSGYVLAAGLKNETAAVAAVDTCLNVACLAQRPETVALAVRTATTLSREKLDAADFSFFNRHFQDLRNMSAYVVAEAGDICATFFNRAAHAQHPVLGALDMMQEAHDRKSGKPARNLSRSGPGTIGLA